MASAEVMSMPVEPTTTTAVVKEPHGAAAAAAIQQQDLYVKLKSLQKHMEFLDIQVR